MRFIDRLFKDSKDETYILDKEKRSGRTIRFVRFLRIIPAIKEIMHRRKEDQDSEEKTQEKREEAIYHFPSPLRSKYSKFLYEIRSSLRRQVQY